MQGVKALVPSFGNWDMAPDVSYTTVFETVRAEKPVNPEQSESSGRGSKLPMANPHHIDWKLNTMSSPIVDLYPNPKKCISAEGKDKHFSARSTLKRIADGIFFESQNAAENQVPTVLQRSISSGITWHARQYGSSGHQRGHRGRENDLEVAKKKHCSYVQLTERTRSVRSEPFYSSPKREKQRSILSAGLHTIPLPHHDHAPLPGRSLSAEMHQNRVLPKFGDWDATGLQFTAIFDQACNEKKSTSGFQGSPSKKVTPTVEDEDLYKPKMAPRRQNGIWTLLCCSNNDF